MAKQWWLKYIHTKYSYNAVCNDIEAFRFSYQNGHLEVSVWLVDTYPNINIDNFIQSCSYGHLESVIWLHNLCSNINIQTNRLQYNCFGGHLEIILWLANCTRVLIYLITIEYFDIVVFWVI